MLGRVVHLLGMSPTTFHFCALQGVSVQQTFNEACAWADLIVLCGTYDQSAQWLHHSGLARHLKGKTVLQLSNGTPQEAVGLAASVRSHKAHYLDACLLVCPLFFSPCVCGRTSKQAPAAVPS
jgi:3-hydroxyisobutyrate dehydrogenase-like beta-hydroxyacid dehydrogenase